MRIAVALVVGILFSVPSSSDESLDKATVVEVSDVRVHKLSKKCFVTEDGVFRYSPDAERKERCFAVTFTGRVVYVGDEEAMEVNRNLLLFPLPKYAAKRYLSSFTNGMCGFYPFLFESCESWTYSLEITFSSTPEDMDGNTKFHRVRDLHIGYSVVIPNGIILEGCASGSFHLVTTKNNL